MNESAVTILRTVFYKLVKLYAACSDDPFTDANLAHGINRDRIRARSSTLHFPVTAFQQGDSPVGLSLHFTPTIVVKMSADVSRCEKHLSNQNIKISLSF
jgi:hypothetical protein